MPEEIKLRIGNLARAVLVTGQAYQDPKQDVLYNHPRAAPEELMRMLVRERRHLVRSGAMGQRPGAGRAPARSRRDVTRAWTA